MEKLYVIKVGGNIIDNPTSLEKFLTNFCEIKASKILVHGGGKVATEMSKSLGIEAKMIDGRRITDAETLKVVTMVYAGLINKNIVAKLQAKGCNAIGMTGADGNSIPATRRKVKDIDYGFVGDIDISKINVNNIELLLKNNFSPIIAPLTHDGQGSLLNTNADTIASGIAVALSKRFEVRLIYCFEKLGVLKDIDQDDSLIGQINYADYENLKGNGIISKGMIPKLDNAFSAINEGVNTVFIGHADNLPGIISGYKPLATQLSL